MTDDEKEKWLEGAEYYGDALENKNLVPFLDEGEIDYSVCMPALKYDKDPTINTSAKPEGYKQVPFKTFWQKILEGYNMSVEATSDLTTLKASTEAARDGALTATTYAERVNADLVGLTVTITDRNGTQKSVDIGFEIYRTYVSVAAMNADAANVPQGKFVVIATQSATDPDNAKMYCKNSQGSFTFLCDLDQASAAAWADWLDTMKPQIEAAIAQAASDHTRANTDHSTATSDHSTAGTDHTTAQSDHTTSTEKSAYAKQQGDYAKAQGDIMAAWNEHQPYIGDGTTGDTNYWYIWVNGQYVKSVYAKGDDLHWEEMSEQEKNDLAQRVLEVLVFATVAEAEAAANELT